MGALTGRKKKQKVKRSKTEGVRGSLQRGVGGDALSQKNEDCGDRILFQEPIE